MQVSTITAQSNVGAEINIEQLSSFVTNNDLSIPKKTNRKKQKKMFRNQMNMRLLVCDTDTGVDRVVSTKVFKNGTLHMTGIASDVMIAKTIASVASIIKVAGASSCDLQIVEYKKLMINVNLDIGHVLDLSQLRDELLFKHDLLTTYDKSVYPGLNCKYMTSDDRRVTILAFHTGKIILTGGGPDITAHEEAAAFIKNVISTTTAASGSVVREST